MPGLQRSEIDIRVGGADLLETFNFNPETIMRLSKQPWEEVRALAGYVLNDLSKLGVDVSGQRRRPGRRTPYRLGAARAGESGETG